MSELMREIDIAIYNQWERVNRLWVWPRTRCAFHDGLNVIRSRVSDLEAELAAIHAHAEDSTEYVLATINRELKADLSAEVTCRVEAIRRIEMLEAEVLTHATYAEILKRAMSIGAQAVVDLEAEVARLDLLVSEWESGQRKTP